jgi:hypothetical protein
MDDRRNNSDGEDGRSKDKRKPEFTEEIVEEIRYIYITAIILWICLVYILGLITNDPIACLILSIPVALYFITMFTVDQCDEAVASQLLQADILAFGVVIITVILNMENNKYSPFFSKLMAIGLALLMFSMIDFWVDYCDYLLIMHVKCILRIAAMAIFIYMLYAYYIVNLKTIGSVINPICDI